MKRERKARDDQGEPTRQRVRALLYLVAALMVPVVIYFGYDIVHASMFPCDSIFKQVQASLKTKIKFIGTEGEVQVGPEKVQDLSERATMTALNLKTCCQALDAGALSPEQFLQCKEQTRAYDADLEQVVTLVKTTLAEETPERAGRSDDQSVVRPEIAEAVEAARNTSKAFNARLVEIRREQALTQLEATPPQHVEVEAQEREPNNDILRTNVIELDIWITGAIGDANDDDFYVFTTPDVYRDIIRIEIENRSTSLRPYIYLFDGKKVKIAEHGSNTPGADVAHQFTSAPGRRHYVHVRSWGEQTAGTYLLRVRPLKAYDAFEPNDSVLKAKPISRDTPIEAGIMDPHDHDYFKVETGASGGPVLIALENRSVTLRPYLHIYDGTKAQVAEHGNGTPGADITYQLDAGPDAKYYVQVRSFGQRTAGNYTLTASQP